MTKAEVLFAEDKKVAWGLNELHEQIFQAFDAVDQCIIKASVESYLYIQTETLWRVRRCACYSALHEATQTFIV